ncbi:hypothetical protein L873DRAFT_1786021 [Choiromyces venosus 120613-1]|uniref:Uncharacterized protein n=1 Tax=Choiromyces venosus 120613-1 TaxID=1336337 RepID=A0A3N4K652_9PEZI|nr:hypothetical protein L873DRAFT_1786021 [Choiromyces venosus 120613-1]
MSECDTAFKKLWLGALEKDRTEGLFSEGLLKLKKKTSKEEITVSCEALLASLESSMAQYIEPCAPVSGKADAQMSSGITGNCHQLSTAIIDTAENDTIAGVARVSSGLRDTGTYKVEDNHFDGMVENFKFRQWKREIFSKQALSKKSLGKEEPGMQRKPQCPGTNIHFPVNVDQDPVSAKIIRKGSYCRTDVTPPIGNVTQDSMSRKDLESYIRSVEDNFMFSSTRALARRPSCVTPTRPRVRLGDYSAFKVCRRSVCQC